ncbi:hypothetical protein AOQ72_04310 [Bradyrhizobium yuanmingense]|uniref:Uncharacterized protein n=1 Tax=Bradyrhizobium yuanmingense TaxID=108015 RepID=A0A0R3BSD3_9BRAD|nr:hypothetical protein AOQ72_04310 [Bradyrhizobium yuanmingense]
MLLILSDDERAELKSDDGVEDGTDTGSESLDRADLCLTPSSAFSVPPALPNACTPMRLTSLLNIQRTSYSRRAVAFAIASKA